MALGQSDIRGGKNLSIPTIKKWLIGLVLGLCATSCQTSNLVSTPSPSPVALSQTTPISAIDKPEVSPLLAQIDKPVAQADPPESQKQAEEVDPKRDYSSLLKDPKELKFKPDDALFRNVYYYIKKSFVEDVPSEKLFEGVKSEVSDLLTQAKVSTKDLSKLDPNKKVLPQLLSLYGSKVDPNLLSFAAILGMLDAVEDRYSLLMLPEDYSQLQEQMQATEFGGIGIYIELDKDHGNRLTVFEPIEGTPAYNAGLHSGDKVLKIDGTSTDGIDIEAAQAKIRGPVGSAVLLEVERKDEPKPLTFKVVRGKIHVVSVSEKLIDKHIGYVRLRQFGARTGEELAAALTRLKSEGATSFILDLRNNGGGYIDASVDVVGQFLDKNNALVVYTIDRANRRREYRSTISGKPLPMIVLINQYSASASEITAGALRDHGVAKLVGHKSFGKGSVQQLYPFSDGSALKLTIAKFYTPAGHVINKVGLEPDVKIDMEPRFVGRGDKDVQLTKAVEMLEDHSTSPSSPK